MAVFQTNKVSKIGDFVIKVMGLKTDIASYPARFANGKQGFAKWRQILDNDVFMVKWMLLTKNRGYFLLAFLGLGECITNFGFVNRFAVYFK